MFVVLYHGYLPNDLTCHLPERDGSECIECNASTFWCPKFHYTDDALMVVIFVTYCYVTYYHKFRSLKYHTFTIAQFLRVRSQVWLNWIFCLKSHKVAVKMSDKLHSHLKVQLEKNLLLSSLRLSAAFISLRYRTEFPVSFWMSASSCSYFLESSSAVLKIQEVKIMGDHLTVCLTQ